MRDIPIDKLFDKTGSIYKLVMLTALRAIDLGGGANTLLSSPQDTKPINIAIEEILEGKISYKSKESKEDK